MRKTAAVCVAKLHDINSELVEDRGFLDTLKVRCLSFECHLFVHGVNVGLMENTGVSGTLKVRHMLSVRAWLHHHQVVPHTLPWLPAKRRQVTGLMYPWRLQDLLADSNPMVVANAVAALAEIHEVSGKDVFQITSQSLFKLLRALNECTEWGQVHPLLQPAVVHACCSCLAITCALYAFSSINLGKLISECTLLHSQLTAHT